MYKKILIANRGEIAVRVIKACKELGIKSVAIYSTTDKDSLHVRLADESICIGPNKATDSYLNYAKVVNAALLTNADAIHPGYGFLSEKEDFVRLCEELGIDFIGPSADTIASMGDKITAKDTMRKAGVSILPGSEDLVYTEEEAYEAAKLTGYPLIIKATSGGGGKGMEIVWKEEDLIPTYIAIKAEAKAVFNDENVYIEKYVTSPKHIEVQVMGDGTGGCLTFFERECSVQRRNQKLIEEAPSACLSNETRSALMADAVRAVSHIKYLGAGTIEYVYDGQNFYFIEMNTRIQVEHCVTERITNFDLIKEQIAVCATGKFHIKQEDIKLIGHSIEARVNAEDPYNNFVPSPGKLDEFILPFGPGIRNETYVYQGYTIPSTYDSMFLKVISHGETREEAIMRLQNALEDTFIGPIKTNIPLTLDILKHPEFVSGDYDTSFIEKNETQLLEGK